VVVEGREIEAAFRGREGGGEGMGGGAGSGTDE
jgi:hypothetical protein